MPAIVQNANPSGQRSKRPRAPRGKIAITSAVTTGDHTTTLSRKLKLMTPVPKLGATGVGLMAGEGTASSSGTTSPKVEAALIDAPPG